MKCWFPLLVLVGPLFLPDTGLAQTKPPDTGAWTFTYVKATEHHKDDLRKFIEKNWFAMDSIAATQGLLKKYELLEHIGDQTATPATFDFIVAVEYLTKGTYADISEKFEVIRKNHVTVKVNGLGFKELGSVVKSETLSRREYFPKR